MQQLSQLCQAPLLVSSAKQAPVRAHVPARFPVMLISLQGLRSSHILLQRLLLDLSPTCLSPPTFFRSVAFLLLWNLLLGLGLAAFRVTDWGFNCSVLVLRHCSPEGTFDKFKIHLRPGTTEKEIASFNMPPLSS